MPEKTITGWATQELQSKLSNLTLGDSGASTQSLSSGWVSGEVSITERKGKAIPIYSLEVEVPFEGSVGGVECKGMVHIPDLSLEMLDDLEVQFECATGDGAAVSAALEESGGADAIRGAVREWATSVRKAVSDNLASVPLDPPSTSRTPRAAALISEEESMSAGGAGELDDGIEEIPHPDDATGGEGEGEEEPPFEEEEVVEMYQSAREMLREVVDESEVDAQLKELDGELAGKDLQERGRILVDVLNYLEGGGEEEEGEEGGEGDPNADPDGGAEDDLDAEYEPYRGEAELQKLWAEVVGLCASEDVPRLEEEVKGKAPEEQWRVLQDVRTYLLEGDDDEQAAFDEWQPTIGDLDAEWAALMERVPPEEAAEVAEDYRRADPNEKKRMVWDVRKFLDDADEGEEGDEGDEGEGGGAAPPSAGGGAAKPAASAPRPPPPRPPTDAELGGKSEVRRRGRGGAGGGRDYEARMEYGFDADGGAARDSGEWDEYYNKELRRGAEAAAAAARRSSTAARASRSRWGRCC